MEEKPLRINKKFIARLSHPDLNHFRGGKRHSNDSIEHCTECCDVQDTTENTEVGTGNQGSNAVSCNGTCDSSLNNCHSCLGSCDGNCHGGTGSLPITGEIIDCPCI